MLAEIITHKREEIARLTVPRIIRVKPVMPVHSCLREKPFIAEVKKMSPSGGEINLRCDPVAQAGIYTRAGAGMVSVLTDEKFFGGSMEDLLSVSNAHHIPVLCKDFIVDEIQIERAYIYGADMILLIVAALSDTEIKTLSQCAERFGMAVLYEIHERGEFERIRHLYPLVVGVNSRDLRTFRIDHDAAAEVMRSLPRHILRIAESGISTAADVARMKKAGADAFLVGTALMRSDDPAGLLEELLCAAGAAPCS